MPDTVSTIIVVLVAIVSLLSYALAWRATRGRSLIARGLVRGGLLLLLLAIPALIFYPMMRAEPPRLAGKIEGQLPSQSSEEPGDSGAKTAVPEEYKRRAEDMLREQARAQKELDDSEAARAKAQERMAAAEPPSKEQSGSKSTEVPKPAAGTLNPNEQNIVFGDQPFAPPQLDKAPSPATPAAPPAPGVTAEMTQPRLVLPPPMPDGTAHEPHATVAPEGEVPPDASAPGPSPGPSSAEPSVSPNEAVVVPGGEPPAASNAPAAAAPDAAWDVVPVFFGTDREEEPNPNRLSFNAERGRRLQLGRALITVPKIHQVPQIERPWALRIPYFDVTVYEQAEDPKQHFTMQEIKKLSREEFLAMVRERLGASKHFKDHALVFVHGYNTSFDHAAYRTAQIAYDLKFDGVPFLYSWPSGGGVASYTYDRESAGASEPYLRQFLEMVVKETGAKSISVIGHSMGNQPLLDVLKDMKNAAPEGVVISQVILAAPDVDADSFINLALGIEGLAQGVTLYAAANDRALTISRNFWRNPRAGDVLATGPLIIPGMDTIDVTAATTDTFALNHSGYAENNVLLQDIGKLIESGLRPPDQRLSNLKRVTTDRGDYWRYMP